jgi:hypothetical protein
VPARAARVAPDLWRAYGADHTIAYLCLRRGVRAGSSLPLKEGGTGCACSGSRRKDEASHPRMTDLVSPYARVVRPALSASWLAASAASTIGAPRQLGIILHTPLAPGHDPVLHPAGTGLSWPLEEVGQSQIEVPVGPAFKGRALVTAPQGISRGTARGGWGERRGLAADRDTLPARA